MKLYLNIGAAVIVSVLIIVAINITGNLLSAPGTPAGLFAGTSETAPEETIIADRAPPATAPVAETAPVATAAGNDSVESGKNLYRKNCKSCHLITADGKNRTGPNLYGVVGREKASAPGFRYSAALKKLGGVWGVDEINSFIAGPRVMVPNTKMTFAGIKKEDQRRDIIAYLVSQAGTAK